MVTRLTLAKHPTGPAGLAEVAAAKADGALAGGVRVAADRGGPA
jgi:hypothetical protein